MPPKFDPATFKRWHTPAEVLDIMPDHLSWEAKRAEIADRMKDGLIRVACETLVDKQGSRGPVEVTSQTWNGFAYASEEDQRFWTAASFEKVVYDSTGYGGTRAARLYGVRLDPVGVQSMIDAITPRSSPKRLAAAIRTLPTPDADPPPSQTAPHPGGRPPKPWWDDLWVEMFRQIWESELQPQSMADIARAMQQWASDNGHELSDPTAKRAARKLWAVAKPRGHNQF